ncbi:TonB-dependent receptor [Phenylobacterium sp.]|uniref:TonB-dependent receptor n=1 Tax=Phenylobacterium sp. TaxID=1871053 RepID=UPI002FC9EAF2
MVDYESGSRRRRLVATAALVGAVSVAGSAAAQTAEAPVALEEIIVTALKRGVALRDAAAAISVVDGEDLQTQQIETLTDLAAGIPSLQIGQAAGVSYVTLRGVSLDSIVGGVEGAVAIHSDGVYLSQATRMDFLLLDAGSVEVLRGPQGTLYGRNATAGAINVTPNRPSGDFGGYVNLSYGNFSTARGEAAITGPLAGERILGRIAVLAEKRGEGYARNVVSGAELGTNEQFGARASLRLLPREDVTLDVSGFHFESRNSEAFQVARGPVGASQLFFNPGFAAYPQSFDPRRPGFNSDPKVKEKSRGLLLVGEWVISPQVTLKSNTSYTDLQDSHVGIDCDGSAIPACTANAVQRSRSVQQEVDLKMSLFDQRLSWIVGAFYDKDRGDHRQSFPFANGLNLGGFPLPDNTAFSEYSVQHTKSLAAFTDATLKLTDVWSLYGGARASRDKRDIVLSSGLENTATQQFFAGCTNAPQSLEYSNVSGKAGLQARITPSSQAYGQWQTGFKAGGFNAAECGGSFKPETITSYEAGYKARFLDGRVDLALSAFHYDYQNIQIGQQFGLAYRVVNVPKAKIDGLELEATVRPFSRVQVDGQVSFLDARFGELSSFDPLEIGAPIKVLDGHRLNRAPRVSGMVGLQQTWPLAGGELTARGEVTFTSRYYFRPFNQPKDSQAGYTTGNAFLTFRPADSDLQLRAFVRNIADTTILSAIFSQDFVQNLQGQYQPPRTFGVGLSHRF